MKQEEEFFLKWNGDTVLRDSDLSAKLAEIQRNVFARLSASGLMEKWLSISAFSPQTLGCTFENTQWVAELFGEERGSELVLVESQEIFEQLSKLNGKIAADSSSPEERKQFLTLVNDRKIAPASAVLPELGLGDPVGRISYPDELPVYLAAAMIL